MGITITAKNSKYSFHMGYGSFFNLRRNIACAYNQEFGEYYGNRDARRDLTQFVKTLEKMINTLDPNEEDSDFFDFLFESDCDGKINYRTCGKIFNLIKDIDFTGKNFVYAEYRPLV